MLKEELLERAIRLVGTSMARRARTTLGIFENDVIERMVLRTQFPIGPISIYSHHIENRGYEEMEQCAIEYYISIKMHINSCTETKDVSDEELIRMFTEPVTVVDSHRQKYNPQYEAATSADERNNIVTYILRDSKVEILGILAGEHCVEE